MAGVKMIVMYPRPKDVSSGGPPVVMVAEEESFNF
jgi:hypothetical protein